MPQSPQQIADFNERLDRFAELLSLGLDMRSIAQRLGVSRGCAHRLLTIIKSHGEDVMRPLNNYRRSDNSLYLNWGNENTGQDSFKRATDDAKAGSEALLDALDRAIFKFGWRHGITAEESRHLLLNTGIRL